MELEQIRTRVKMELSPSRYLHSVGVEEVACDLAAIYGYEMEKASLAGILHDCAKNLTDPELLTECEQHRIPVTDVERECAFLLHAKVGALFAKIKYGIEDPEILDAITYHTTGRPKMSLLEKIIFTADYIEPYRKPLPRIDEIRRAAYANLDWGVYLILENVLNYLKESGSTIDTQTVDTFDYYKEVLQQR